MPTRRLTADEAETLVQLLKPAVSRGELETYVYLATGDRLFVEFVEPNLPLTPTIRKLIEALELGPITEQFLRVVFQKKIYQTELRAYIVKLYPTIAEAAGRELLKFDFQEKGQPTSALSAGPGLERVVRPALAVPDTEIWLDRFNLIKRQVCRVEADGTALGTGFIVGPRAILTNWHVVDAARKAGLEAALQCRFDFRKLTQGGTDPGVVLKVASVLDEHPCSQAELTENPENPAPRPDELDYALLAMDADLSDRGSIPLRPPPPVGRDAALIIVQHPQGEPLRFAIDTLAVIGMTQGGLRLRYRTNTEPGSSGSPCFDMDWNLLALHHLGDPARGPATFNQGVPVGLIRASIEAGGHAAALSV